MKSNTNHDTDDLGYRDKLDEYLLYAIQGEENRYEEEFPDLIFIDDEPIIINKNGNEV